MYSHLLLRALAIYLVLCKSVNEFSMRGNAEATHLPRALTYDDDMPDRKKIEKLVSVRVSSSH